MTRTVFDDMSDSSVTYTWEGDPDVVREELFQLGLFRRPDPPRDNRSQAMNPAAGSNLDDGTPVEVARAKPRWRQIAEFIESLGPPDYAHTQAMIERKFLGRRLSAAKEKAIYAAWFRPSRKARRELRAKLGGAFRRSPTADEEGSFGYRLVKS